MKSSTKEALVTGAMVLLFATILFSQPRLVGGLKGSFKKDTTHCNGKGMINSDNTCNCYSGYRGANCTLRYCPFGKSWATMPEADHERNRPNVECSDMGSCDLRSGLCTCREGFEGRACERMSCPTAVSDKTCSGHGRCLTMREASNEFNGYSLVRPPVDYSGWDADAIQGCVCDNGFEGYDCSRRRCPYGIDPLSSGTPQRETVTLVCGSYYYGHFNMEILGYSTPPINTWSGVAALKYILESVPGVGKVTVTAEGTKTPGTFCGRSGDVKTTYITFDSYTGATPPRLYIKSGLSVSSLLVGGTGGELGSLQEGSTFYLQTSYTLTCPACDDCTFGAIWFSVGDSLSDEVLVLREYASVSSAISDAIAAMDDLRDAGWENLEVVVTARGDDTRLCVPGQANSFQVDLRSNYGNLPFVTMIGSAWKGEKNEVLLSWTGSGFQEGTPLPCSGQGFCNYTAGRCQCSRLYEQNKLQFEMTSSDGEGGPGGLGDCGFYKRSKSSTLSAACQRATNITNGDRTLCSGHGECLSELSDACTCYSGWSGILCDVATTCPSGPAWFDEALSSSVAHQLAVCSNMGLCDAETGRCLCRKGFHGSACQYMDCPRDSNGVACNGKGWCMSMHKWAEIAGFEYGDELNLREEPGAWDAFGFHACMCSAAHPSPYSLSGRSNTQRPTVGPIEMIDGYPGETPKLPGWRGYNCQERNCPSGNRIVSPATRSAATAVFEEQTVSCVGDRYTSSFTLSFYGHETDTIYGYMNRSEIKAAIEWAPTIGNVTISFLDADIPNACDSSFDASSGFVIRFDTELGDLPLFEESSVSNAVLYISESVPGTLTDEECGGIQSGVCDRTTGTCMCHGRLRSSGGTNNIGTRGDCGYYYEGVVDLDYI